MPTYPRIEVSVDVVALTGLEGVLHVLLVRRARTPYVGRWALPGGFLEVDEDLAPAAARELHIETGIALHPDELVQIGTYGAPHRDPRRRIVSVAHLAELDRDVDPQPGPDAEHVAQQPVVRGRRRVGRPLGAARRLGRAGHDGLRPRPPGPCPRRVGVVCGPLPSAP